MSAAIQQCVRDCARQLPPGFCRGGIVDNECLCKVSSVNQEMSYCLAGCDRYFNIKCEWNGQGDPDQETTYLTLPTTTSSSETRETSQTTATSELPATTPSSDSPTSGASSEPPASSPASNSGASLNSAPSDAAAAALPPDSQPTSGGGLSAGAKGGIAAGVLVGAIILIAIAFLLFRRRRIKPPAPVDSAASETGGAASNTWSKPELDGNGMNSFMLLHGQGAPVAIFEMDSNKPSNSNNPTSTENSNNAQMTENPRNPNKPNTAELSAIPNISRKPVPSNLTGVTNAPGPQEQDGMERAVLAPGPDSAADPTDTGSKEAQEDSADAPQPSQPAQSAPQTPADKIPDAGQSPPDEPWTCAPNAQECLDATAAAGKEDVDDLVRLNEQLEERRRTLQELMEVQELQAAVQEKISKIKSQS